MNAGKINLERESPVFSKLESACIKLLVPKSGDDELDALIREARCLIREARCCDLHGMSSEAWKEVMELELHASILLNEFL